MRKVVILLAFVVVLMPWSLVRAGESSPYVLGEWFLSDSFEDGTTPVNITDTQFTFLNPTNQTLFLEYAFFDTDGGFCGCDRDILQPNGRVRYTMSAEAGGSGFPGAQFSCVSGGKPTKTEGTMKSIAFQIGHQDKHYWDGHHHDNPDQNSIDISNALQVGYQIHFFQSGPPTEAGLKAISITQTTFQEILSIHKQCVDFCNKTGLCPPLQ